MAAQTFRHEFRMVLAHPVQHQIARRGHVDVQIDHQQLRAPHPDRGPGAAPARYGGLVVRHLRPALVGGVLGVERDHVVAELLQLPPPRGAKLDLVEVGHRDQPFSIGGSFKSGW